MYQAHKIVLKLRCVEDECRQKTTEEGKGWSSVVVLRFATTCRRGGGDVLEQTTSWLVADNKLLSDTRLRLSKGFPRARAQSAGECSRRAFHENRVGLSPRRARWHLSAGMAGKAKIRRTSALSSTTLLCLSLGNKGFVSTFCFAPSTTRITPMVSTILMIRIAAGKKGDM